MRSIIAIFIVAFCGIVYGQPGVRAGKTATGISYDVQGRGPVVVLLTGSNLDRRMWARETAWLARDRTVVRYDLRAHGQSDTATAPFSHLGDLIDVLDTLKIPRASLVGLSAGSAIALDAALEHPSRVERIVLSGPAPADTFRRSAPRLSATWVRRCRRATTKRPLTCCWRRRSSPRRQNYKRSCGKWSPRTIGCGRYRVT